MFLPLLCNWKQPSFFFPFGFVCLYLRIHFLSRLWHCIFLNIVLCEKCVMGMGTVQITLGHVH